MSWEVGGDYWFAADELDSGLWVSDIVPEGN
jgi:hypothetical protein